MLVQSQNDKPIDENEIFRILGNDRRRYIIQFLADESDIVDVSDIAEGIATKESDTSSTPKNLYKSVYVSLQQTHLPQLEEAQVIHYDPNRKTVTREQEFEAVYQYLHNDRSGERHIEILTFVLVLAGLLFIALTGIGILGIEVIDAIVVSTILFFILGLLSLYRLFIH